MKFGIDRLIAEPTLRAPLKKRRLALLAHPASVTSDLTHALDALAACGDMKITAAFGQIAVKDGEDEKEVPLLYGA
jgi:uncharacterized protein YbbC (DUF1343 family)